MRASRGWLDERNEVNDCLLRPASCLRTHCSPLSRLPGTAYPRRQPLATISAGVRVVIRSGLEWLGPYRAGVVPDGVDTASGRPLVDDLGVMRNEDELAAGFLNRVGRGHLPRLDFPQGKRVVRLADDGRTALCKHEVEACAAADETPLPFGEFVETERFPHVPEVSLQPVDIPSGILGIERFKTSIASLGLSLSLMPTDSPERRS